VSMFACVCGSSGVAFARELICSPRLAAL
jgi:hypothetical protein